MKHRIALCSFTLAVTGVLSPATSHAQSVPPQSPWVFSSGIAVKETYDSNVFLQDVGALDHKSSMVSSVTPSLALTYQPGPAFKAAFTYAPEVAWYHSYSSENYVAHRAAINLSGKSGATAWELNNALTGIDGSDLGPTFDIANGGAVPALGGIPLRDRRDAIIYRNNFKLTQTIGKWFIRPVVSSYVHDFETKQKTTPGYENYVDRNEVSGGLDVGYEAWDKTWLVLGYRYGHQHQGELLGIDSLYSNDYQRVLAGVEGNPAPWLKLSLLGGPDFRNFSATTLPPTFNPDALLFYLDASATVTLGKSDTLTVILTRFEQTAFSSQSMYEDVVYSLGWRHQCNEQFAVNLGLKIYQGDWQSPVRRNDIIYTPSVGVTYTFNKQLSADLGWSYDTVNSEIPSTDGREFTRNLVSLGAKYTF